MFNTIEEFNKLDSANRILSVQRALACAHSLNDMGFIRDSQLGSIYENEYAYIIYDDDYYDCPCCQADYMSDDDYWYDGLFFGYDADYADAYEKSNREKARDRYRRNTTKQGTFGMRGYKSRGRTFKRG